MLDTIKSFLRPAEQKSWRASCLIAEGIGGLSFALYEGAEGG
jgi:hypothetical protein